ncbi:MAG: 5-formyltetrahydrofolate cyclo-ligase [Candidatus Binatia bacterium]
MIENPESTMHDVVAAKKRLRRSACTAIRGIAPSARADFDNEIEACVRRTPAFQAARQLIGYWALADEVPVFGLLRAGFEEGKSVLLPIVTEGSELKFGLWQPGGSLELGPHALRQPREPVASLSAEPSLTLVPGRAFDARGNRLGRGGGFYDRCLDNLSLLGAVVGVAYEAQLVESVPVEPHDRLLDAVVTERTIYVGDAWRLTDRIAAGFAKTKDEL